MASNDDFIALLAQRFNDALDQGLKQRCLTKSKECIEQNLANRAFDEFPTLVDDTTFPELLERYQNLLRRNCSLSTLREFEKGVIHIACDSLFDERGQLNNKLKQLLGWDSCTKPIDNYAILTAFIGTLNQQMIECSLKLTREYKENALAIINSTNTHYGQWCKDVLRERGIRFDPKYDTDKITFDDIVKYPKEHPGLVVSVVAAGIVGAGLFAAGKAIQHVINENAPLTMTKQ